MEINFEKKKVLIEWINCVIDEASISSLQELKNSAKLLTKLLNNIDPDVVVPNVGNSECVSFIVCHIKGFFSIDIVDEKEILLGNELEIGKLLCLMLELTLTSENNMETIEKVQNLPKSVQTGIMAVTNLVGENSQSSNLSQILNNWLIQNAFEDISTSSGMSPIVSTAVIPIASSTIFESPKLHSTIGDLSGNSSPLQVFSASPQALYRRVMVENKKLKQKVRHSELFLKQQSQFIEQLDVDAETEKKELFNQHMKLVKEHDALLQKFYDSESSLSKIKEEIEFLQLEVHSKEKEVIEQTAIAKELKEVVKSLQESLEHYSDIDAKLQLQQSVNAEQVSKNTNLSLKINQLEEEKCTLKSELLKAKEAVNKLTSDLFKKQADYVDQTKHLENEVKRLENELSNSQACQESLGETLKRESEITKLRNSLNIQEHTIVNMGIDSQRKDAKLNDLMTELETIRQKYDEESESFKKQSSQFMDQISSLLKQTEEQKFNHEQLTVKIQSAEERSKLLERQIESYEQNEKKINEQIQLQGSDLKAKTFGVTALQHELDDTKAKLMQQNMLNAQLEAKLEVLKFEKQNRIETEKQYQSLLVENLHLKHTQEKYELLKTEMEKLKSLEEECRVLREKTVRLELELKSSVERCSELKENVQLSKQYEQKCIVLDEKLMSLNEDIRLKEMNFEKELKSSRLLYDELLSVKNNSEVEIKSYQEQNSILKVKNKELEEFKSQFVAIESANEKLQAENLSLQVFVNACPKLEEENLKLKAELLQMTSQFSASSSELARITQENQQNKLNELQKSLNGCKNNVSEVADLKMRVNDLLKEKSDLLSLLECEKQLNVSMKRSEMLMEKKCDAILHEKDLLEKEIKRQCELFDIERNEVNEHVDNAILEYQDNVLTFENEKANFLKLRSDNKKLCREVDAKKKSILNLEEKCKELASEVELKQESINRLENRCVEQDIACRNLTSNNRSLETQLASAENIIQNLKKEIQALSSSKSCSAEVQKKRSRDVYGDESSSGSDDVLKISDLEIESRSNRADEIFQRSRSKRVARRQTLLSVTHEEDVSETDENVTIGSYSLRRTAERRRSLQPRRYLGGRTPPSRRTLMGVPAQAQMCNFSVDVEQEPEVMDDMEWGRIAKLKDVSKETFSDAEEKTRLEELHRRNTLCLPHLKSSYPIELSVKGANDQDEQMKTLGKRKNDVEEDAPRATYKKWKTEQLLLSSTDLSNFTRAVKSESNVCANARMTNKSEKTSNTFADKLLEKPHPQTMSFEISVEPAKTIKPPPRLTRSVASTSIKNTQIAPQKLQESIYPVVLLTQNKAMENKSSDSSLKNKSKDLPSQISRGENKRNSFSRATHKVAATFRGKMMAKNK